MKRTILTAAMLTFLAGGPDLARDARGAGKEDDTPHRVGLIDVNYVFEHYDKLKLEIEDLKAKAQEEENRLRGLAKKYQEMGEELKAFADGSQERSAREAKLTKMAAEIETQGKVTRMNLERERAKILHTAYLETQDAVEKFCDRFGFTVVIQFVRTDANSTDPRKMQQSMTQMVVFHRKRDDLTDGVLKYLNDRYQQSAGESGKPVTDKPEKPSKTAKSTKKDRNVQPAAGSQD